MVPVTVAQLKKAISMASEDGEVTVHGKDLRHFHFRVVGRISALQPLTTQMIFTIEDSTESIQVTWWVDSEETPFITERKSSWKYVWLGAQWFFFFPLPSPSHPTS
jgi:hypothetical protein